jgi:methyltransferase (TIGR00027 family)
MARNHTDGSPSSTATWVACARGALSFEETPLVTDLIAEKLVPAPYDRLLRWTRTAGPRSRRVLLVLAHAAALGSARHIALRTRVIDEELAAFASPGAQLVILGAGLDSRALRLASLGETTVFEIDHPSVQAYKRARVAGLPQMARDLRWVGVDFEKDDLAGALAAAGYDRAAPTLFLWEGVTMYLTRAALGATLRALGGLAAPGARLVMSYWAPEEPSLRARALMLLVRSGREPIRTLLRPVETALLLAENGFAAMWDSGTRQWGERYLGHAVGGPPERLVVAKRIAGA